MLIKRPRQKVAALALAYAAIVTWKCPCGRVNHCHLPHFVLSVGLATGIIAYDNLA